MDVPVQRQHARVDRLELLRISVNCVLQHKRQVVGQAGRERDIEGLHALGSRDELDTRVGGKVEA
eukprot:3466818-Prymnesium_polylepis.1